ncbi:MAG TPA: DUF4350 domain-containing protein [Acidimicrobiales bacterium]|nr:DUF4350 domain-containing protein [Acidimicrobiales bacterium]
MVVLLVSFNLMVAGVGVVTGGPAPAGPPSSSYATVPEGLAAYADLLAELGHPVRRLRTTLDEAELDPRSTVVVADPVPLSKAENAALSRFVADGGRLVAAGADVVPSLRQILARAPVWAPAGARSARPLLRVPELADVSLVRSAGRGSWSEAGTGQPVLGTPGAGAGADPDGGAGGGEPGGDRNQRGPTSDARPPAILATVATAGAGRVIALADTSPLHNAFLAEADNAAFALAVAGERGRPVAFAEAAHGYADSEGIAAVPRRWRLALAGVVVAILVWMWSRGRRHGPPEDEERAMPPPRRAYVDAMAASLAKTRKPAMSVRPLQESARRRLARRAGLAPDAGDDAIRAAALRLGVPEEEVAALFAPPRNDRELLAVGRAAARVPGHADQERRPW